MKKGSMILVDKIDTQLGTITADDGHGLLAVFLGSVPKGEDPAPEERLHSLGWRQMAMFEVVVTISCRAIDLMWNEYTHVFSCLGMVDAAEAAGRHADHVLADNYVPEQDPTIESVMLKMVEFGPIGEDGTPHPNKEKILFRWCIASGVPWEEHMDSLRAHAESLSA